MIILLADTIIGGVYGILAYLLLSWIFSAKAALIGGIVTMLITIFVLLIMQGAAIGGDKYEKLEGRPNDELH